VVVVADGYGQPAAFQIRSDHASLAEVITCLGSRPPANCGMSVLNGEGSKFRVRRGQPIVRFGDVARIRIGAVTGDAEYFLFTESQRIVAGLSQFDVRPVLTRARHLTASSVGPHDWARLLKEGERVWLLWPNRRGRPSKALTAYLRAGQAAKCHLREKVRVRSPWYRARLPPPADGFISGMTPVGPWIALNRMQGLTATNTLYTVHFARRLALREKAAWALALMCTTTASQHRALGRRYSDGLLKFEPKDVMALMVPRPANTGADAVRVYDAVIDELTRGNVTSARSRAEAFVLGGG
jgi:hypothetical protein